MVGIKICRDCKLVCRETTKRPWIYLIVVFVASFSAFVTWLSLDSAGIQTNVNRLWSGGVFILVSIILILYYFSCMRRYCMHRRNMHQ